MANGRPALPNPDIAPTSRSVPRPPFPEPSRRRRITSLSTHRFQHQTELSDHEISSEVTHAIASASPE
jgi:hypothetical protein